MIGIDVDDPLAKDLNDIADVEKLLPGYVSGIREWFRWYKTPDDKPLNAFGFDEKALNKVRAYLRGQFKQRALGWAGRRLLGCGCCGGRVWVPGWVEVLAGTARAGISWSILCFCTTKPAIVSAPICL